MGQKLGPQDLVLYRAVDEVLHYVWDPIGVRHVPQARDEYHAYLPQVFALVHRGAQATEIANLLGSIISGRMELPESAQHDLEVAHVLLAWRKATLAQPA